jgi:arsenate reductase
MQKPITEVERTRRSPSAPKRVLFLCTHNSARSQIAEALLRDLGDARFDVMSAGTEPGRLHPLAVKVMAESGIDITGQHAKGVEEYTAANFDYVITVCDDAQEACPNFPGARKQLHWSLPDPSAVHGSEEERLMAFRSVRDRLATLIREFIAGAER